MRALRTFSVTRTQQRLSDPRHFLAVPPGLHLLSDMVNSSPILAADRGHLGDAFTEAGPSTGAAGAAGGFEFGVDPSLDPELALVRHLYPFLAGLY